MAATTRPAGCGGGGGGGGEEAQSASSRFFAAIAAEAGLSPPENAEEAAVVTMKAMLERLTSGQAHALVSSLPSTLQLLLAHVAHDREGRRTLHGGLVELVDRISADLGVAPVSAELIACAVFRALRALVPAEIVAHIAQQLPIDLRAAWLSFAPTTDEEVAGDLELMRRMVEDIERTCTLPLRVTAREAFSSVMCLLSQRLSGGETKELFLGLPRTIRPLVERCMLERHEAPLAFGAGELVANVAQDLGTDLEEAETIVAAVIATVTRALPQEEIEHVASQLPEDLRALWLA